MFVISPKTLRRMNWKECLFASTDSWKSDWPKTKTSNLLPNSQTKDSVCGLPNRGPSEVRDGKYKGFPFRPGKQRNK